MKVPSMLPAGALHATTSFCRVAVDPAVGNLPMLAFRDGDVWREPLHRAPWVDDGSFPEAMPLVDRRLSGDFVCIPFGLNDVEGGPLHGWSANSAWSVTNQSVAVLKLALDRTILGARVEKTVRPAMDAPLLYQEHHLIDGDGAVTFAHHPMMRVTGGAQLFTSPKRLAITLDAPIVEGHHVLACGAAVDNWHAVPAQTGGTIDVANLPIADNHEDFVALVEAEGSTLGWTAVIREAFDDIVFVLKDPRILPLTMLWHSNGGRKDAPWDGRHRGVLGIEDGVAAGGSGHRAALDGNTVYARHGIQTALPLANGQTHRIAHVIGCLGRPAGWQRITDIRVDGDELILQDATGDSLRMPFDGGFF